ncbi:helix-turn-helix domain-containing protein [Alteraurantiacibacter buctensis]|uniref:Helix-turn-helix domain-containing protein n=1 Tax=Alteraurantiacibacter buctensis TaxID=1503981 RepID=A0A844YXC2_9SPHN|nr:helix-turn-helix transcriptional regulator [Alteraurantiacibacter buctensis]MXO72995.1 helix-turn-helix domain-containing protein [Alteraurantiacibacter buctensis]
MAFNAALLRKKLKEEGRTRAFLAELTGKNERTVSRWLNGGNSPKTKDLEKIATALNCRPQDFDPRYADEGPGVPVTRPNGGIVGRCGTSSFSARRAASSRCQRPKLTTLNTVLSV